MSSWRTRSSLRIATDLVTKDPETQSLMRSMFLAMEELRDNRERACYAVLYRMLGIPPPDPKSAGSLRADCQGLRGVIIDRKPQYLRLLLHC